MVRAMEVRPRDGYCIWLRYSDGTAGEIDLSDLVGKGVFRAWRDHNLFNRVHITPHGSISWSGGIEICPDSLYADLTGESAEVPSANSAPAPADA